MPGFQQVSYRDPEHALKFQIATIAVCVGCAILSLFGLLPAWAIRWIVCGIVITQATQELLTGDKSTLKSPAFLLGALSGIMFSAVPAGYTFVLQSLEIHDFIPSPHRLAYFGHLAERYVLVFALILIALHGAFRLLVTPRTLAQSRIYSSTTERQLAVFSVLLSLSAFASIKFGVGPPTLTQIFSTLYAPFQAFIILFLLHQYLAQQSKLAPLFISYVLVTVFLISTLHLKPFAYITVSCLMYFGYSKAPGLRRALKILSITGFAVFILMEGVLIAKVTRGPFTHNEPSHLSWLVNLTAQKAIWRQVDTGDCLRGVVDAHAEDAFEWPNQLFWIHALIPRIVWPEKENFSLGEDYSTTYCDSSVKTGHSASITLLGQPIIKGGPVGLLFHGTILITGLGALTYCARRFSGMGSVIVMALLPWWIDFDQDFALYVANLIKFFLLICLVAVPVHLFGQPAEEHRRHLSQREGP